MSNTNFFFCSDCSTWEVVTDYEVESGADICCPKCGAVLNR